jgi:hypothetical protein
MKMHLRPRDRLRSINLARIRFFSSQGGAVRTMLDPNGKPPYNMLSSAAYPVCIVPVTVGEGYVIRGG